MPVARLTLALIILTACAGGSVSAYSPYAQLLADPDGALRWAPEAILVRELDRIAPPGSCEFHAVPAGWDRAEIEQSRAVDLAEVQAALHDLWKSRPADPTTRPDAGWDESKTLAAFKLARENMDGLHSKTGASPPDLRLVIPPGFPAEFVEYDLAMADFRSGKSAAARARWEKVLGLPESQRKHRSVWAAYMIGKSWRMKWDTLLTADDPEIIDPAVSAQHSIEWCRKTRELAKAGFPDPLGLAASSLCWEASAELALAAGAGSAPGQMLPEAPARAAYRAQHIMRGIHLYLQAYAAGQPHADEALQQICRDLFDRQPEVLLELVRDEQSAAVLTSFILARGGKLVPAPKSPQVKLWLDVVESASPLNGNSPTPADRLGADRLLWACYLYDIDRKTAAGWRGRSLGKPLSDWIWAKMCLADGPSRIDEAEELMWSAAAHFPKDEIWPDVRGGYYYEAQYLHDLLPHDRVDAELGVIELARGRYKVALDLLLRAGWWEDAAYIAECVLTPEELNTYVDEYWPATPLPAANTPQAMHQARTDAQHRREIRGALARRLTRLGRWKQARPYLNDADRAILDSYVSAIRDGHDADRSDDDRAESFWKAARIANDHGLELFWHESSPASYYFDSVRAPRINYRESTVASRQTPTHPMLLGATPDELTRAAANSPQRYSRMDARYIAAAHAWSAAQLMPDESDETALVLCTAGHWLKNMDEQFATRYYRALIDRCGTTELGRQAAATHRLPSLP